LPSPLVAHHAIRPRLLTERIEGRVVVRLVGHARMDSLGVRVGQELTHVDGIPVERYAEEQVAPYVSASTVHDREDRVFGRVLLAGAQGRSVRLTLVDADGTVRTVDAPRDTALAWRRVPPFSLTMRPDSIAVVSLTTFADASVVGEFERVLPSLSRARGLIIDIRENDGGNSRHGWDILARLIGQPSRTASWSTPQYRPAFRSWGRSSGTYREEGARVIPRAPHFPGPVAVLIGRRTFSAAEDFAVAFDVARRGPLIGEPTGGSTGNPISLRLPGGGHARICAKDDRYPDGRTFVGVGVQPTIAVVRTIADLRAGRDATLERAVEALTRPRVRTPVRGARGARAAATMSASR
ncbi:MAG: S41 family peptidase, partial [Gemmatimonadaceae bacterium]|nr:S41 family peptidase [Gemmatimonadaceae bacterium]